MIKDDDEIEIIKKSFNASNYLKNKYHKKYYFFLIQNSILSYFKLKKEKDFSIFF
jgi:hypothetical protein